MIFFHFLEKIGADGKQIASHQFLDFAGVPKACPHHFRLVAKFFVVIANFGNRFHLGSSATKSSLSSVWCNENPSDKGEIN